MRTKETAKEWRKYMKRAYHRRDPIVSRPQFINRGPRVMNHGRNKLGPYGDTLVYKFLMRQLCRPVTLG
jgi:hypothetical protein